jgi:hypothetical protein
MSDDKKRPTEFNDLGTQKRSPISETTDPRLQSNTGTRIREVVTPPTPKKKD